MHVLLVALTIVYFVISCIFVYITIVKKKRFITVAKLVVMLAIIPYLDTLFIHGVYYLGTIFWEEYTVIEVHPVDGFSVYIKSDTYDLVSCGYYLNSGYKYIEIHGGGYDMCRCNEPSYNNIICNVEFNSRYSVKYRYMKTLAMAAESKTIIDTKTNTIIARQKEMLMEYPFVPFSWAAKFVLGGTANTKHKRIGIEFVALPPICKK